jgi:hypothetical protein
LGSRWPICFFGHFLNLGYLWFRAKKKEKKDSPTDIENRFLLKDLLDVFEKILAVKRSFESYPIASAIQGLFIGH